MKDQNTDRSDSKVRVGTVVAIVLASVAIVLLLGAICATSGCEPMDTDTDGGELMTDDNIPQDDTDIPGIDNDGFHPNGEIGSIDPASCDKLLYIAGDWYNDASLKMTVTLYTSSGGVCRVNFTGYTAFSGDFFGTTVPLVKEGSCGWLIVTVLADGNLLQSGYA